MNRKKLTKLAALALALALILCSCGGTPSGNSNSVPANNTEPSGNSDITPANNTDAVPANNAEPSGNTEPDDKPSDGTGRWENSDYISVRKAFTAKSGEYELVMTGLTEDSAAYVLESLKELDLNANAPLKIVHKELVDAEKWKKDLQFDEDKYDSNQCWAASIANMLWMSGWTKGLTDPRTGSAFTSEDSVFEYFNDSFSDRGCDAAKGVDWFFMGGYAADWSSMHPALLQNDPSPKDGLLKSFVSTLAVKGYDLTSDASQIAQLEKTDMNSTSPAVFQGSIGTLMDNVLQISEHSITVAGAVIDPNAETPSERYKAIIIIDSDNDGSPDPAQEETENLTIEQKNAYKEARPNSCTVYKLNYTTDAEGTDYWQIAGYGESTNALYSIMELSLPSDGILSACRETEGSMAPTEDPDFVTGLMFTTSETESVMDPYFFDDEIIQTVFGTGEAVNLNFFVKSLGYKAFDDEFRGNADLTAEWKVASADGTVMASGSVICNNYIDNDVSAGYLVPLNSKDGKIQAWPAGKYTVSVTVNPDHAVKEAYYLNNVPGTITFEIK